MGKKHYIIICITLLLLTSIVYAAEGNIHLLALLKKDGANEGLLAGLDLKILEGKESVFLHTFPMTQVSTQVSMRFAQQVACNQFELDCSDKDFLFTITAVPGIIGGPSAGAAGAVLTTALLLDKPLNDKIAITGTINSGGIIGPIGGVDKKIEIAAKKGIKEVLIPMGTMNISVDNVTINLEQYGQELGIKVTEVATLTEAVKKFTGYEKKKKNSVLTIDEKYLDKMAKIADTLCSRAEELKQFIEVDVEGNFTEKSIEALEKGDYYSAASYCFRENVALQKEIFSLKNNDDIKLNIEKLEFITAKLKEKINETPIRTLTDIETYMAVMERIEETEQLLKEAAEKTEQAGELTALATERLYSANTWAEFFDLTYDTRIIIDDEKVKKSCSAKISEAEERFNYAKIVFKTENFDKIKKMIDAAYTAMGKDDNIMCLYKASKAKADSDVLLVLHGVKNENFDKVMEIKFNAAREAISRSLAKGAFPIIAYSYYEYAQNLFKYEEPVAAMFAEYALELSNIDLYFKMPSKSKIEIVKGEEIDKERTKKEYIWKVMVTGFFILLIILAIVIYEIGSRKRDKKIKEFLRKQRKKKRKKK